MTKIGPAGNSNSFYEQGHTATVEAPAWLHAMGLNAYEYSSGRGVQIGEATAREIAAQAREHGIAMSIHAPYYINCATLRPESAEKTIGYLLSAAHAVNWLGGDRVIYHPGSAPDGDLRTALERTIALLRRARERMGDEGLSHVCLCPETTGRRGQFGDLGDVLAICADDETSVPAIDFAHLHAAGGGGLCSIEAFDQVLSRALSELGPERMQRFHMHFSHIEYAANGERRHRTFAETEYGPNFELLAPLLCAYRLTPVIICECNGTQAEDACAIREMLRSAAEAIR